MTAAPAGETVLLPRGGRATSGSRGGATGLPADLLSQSAARLRTLALLYAFVYFFAGFFPALLFEQDRELLFQSFRVWGPGAISISIALLVAAVIRSARVPLPAVMMIGLAFEVVSSYFIAAAEFLDPMGLSASVRWLGLSWVAVWTMLFTIVVPTEPRRAVVAALASVELGSRHGRARDGDATPRRSGPIPHSSFSGSSFRTCSSSSWPT